MAKLLAVEVDSMHLEDGGLMGQAQTSQPTVVQPEKESEAVSPQAAVSGKRFRLIT